MSPEASRDPDPTDPGTSSAGSCAPWRGPRRPVGHRLPARRSALVSERDTTRVVAVAPSGRVRPSAPSTRRSPQGEAGLLGLAAQPDVRRGRARLRLRLDRRGQPGRADDLRRPRHRAPEPVLTGIPNGFIHDGGRLLFDDEGKLFVSTGETGEPELAQDRDSLGGKILRITPDGEPAPGNPVAGSPVWTLGHRNVQGLAFDDAAGCGPPSSAQQTWDELNLIEKARNYGWPVVEGAGDCDDYRNPFVEWATAEASPSGLAFLDGSLWAGALRGERLWQVPGRPSDGVRDARVVRRGLRPDCARSPSPPRATLWVTTSNRDGRGSPHPSDDRILEIALR